MMAFVIRRDRPVLAGPTPTDRDKVQLFDSMQAYSGTYTLDDCRVIHHINAAWTRAWVGDQVRPFRLDGDTLIISGAPSKDPATGEDVLYRIEFTRA